MEGHRPTPLPGLRLTWWRLLEAPLETHLADPHPENLIDRRLTDLLRDPRTRVHAFQDQPLGRCILAQGHLGGMAVTVLPEGVPFQQHHAHVCPDPDQGLLEGPNLVLWNGTTHKRGFELKDDGDEGPRSNRHRPRPR